MSDILRLSVPLSVWLATFSAVYGLQGLVCADLWSGSQWAGLTSGRRALIVAWVLAVAIQAAFLVALRAPRWRARSDFIQRTAQLLAVVALVAAVWTLAPVVFATTCT